MIIIAIQNDINVPVYNEDIQIIQDYMSFYKFISKQLVQTRNYLESRIYNQ